MHKNIVIFSAYTNRCFADATHSIYFISGFHNFAVIILTCNLGFHSLQVIAQLLHTYALHVRQAWLCG